MVAVERDAGRLEGNMFLYFLEVRCVNMDFHLSLCKAVEQLLNVRLILFLELPAVNKHTHTVRLLIELKCPSATIIAAGKW
jgi:hypothetical protein